MEALNNETPIVEFNIDNFQGGLECDVEEVGHVLGILRLILVKMCYLFIVNSTRDEY